MSVVLRFRLAAFLLAGNCLLGLLAAGVLVRSLMTDDRQLTLVGMGVAFLVFVLIIAQWIAATGAWCPLCRTAVLAPKRCMKHRKARTLLGSHRLRVAAAILFKNGFRCPYCNEPTGMEVRETLERPRPRRPQMY